jgi:hypothetical protein
MVMCKHMLAPRPPASCSLRGVHSACVSCVVCCVRRGRDWLEHAPSPPLRVLRFFRRALPRVDASLAAHLSCLLPGGPADALWPLCASLATCVLARDAWLALFDCSLVTTDLPDPAVFFPAACVALAVYFRHALLQLTSAEDVRAFFSHEQSAGAGWQPRRFFPLLFRVLDLTGGMYPAPHRRWDDDAAAASKEPDPAEPDPAPSTAFRPLPCLRPDEDEYALACAALLPTPPRPRYP